MSMTSFDKAVAIKEMDRIACGTAGIASIGDDILMIRRAGGHGAGTWSVPGGWVDAGEDPADTIKREMREEVGIIPTEVEFLTYTFDQHPEGIEDVCLWFKIHEWIGIPQIMEPDKVDSLVWASRRALPLPLFNPISSLMAMGKL